MTSPATLLAAEELERMNAWWRAANYLSVGQIYLLANPLLKEPLSLAHIKPRLLGHWGTTPGLNFIYVHMNRAIRQHDLNMIFIAGPGHGGPAVVANTWLEGSYSELYHDIAQDEEGMRRLFRQFSFPGGIPSHASPDTPGSIHEGGELGYALFHAYGAVFDNPDLIACCVVGDGEAETGPLATSWHSNKFLNPRLDGVVLPILHLNGYKIANPTVLARISHSELECLFVGYGYKPYVVEGDDPETMHRLMADAVDTALAEISEIKRTAWLSGEDIRPRWPMIILRSPKGWSGPKSVDGKKSEGSWRSHQVPFSDMDKPEHVQLLAEWMQSYRPDELFDADWPADPRTGSPRASRRTPHGRQPTRQWRRLAARPAVCRIFATTQWPCRCRAARWPRRRGRWAIFLRDVMRRNPDNFRVFGPDETASNRLGALFEVTDRTWMAERFADDEHLAPDGRVMEILSEHACQGWLEGYLLTGRHGLFSCYEAFIHIVDSMFNQHAKWLKMCGEIPWRRPIASLNILLTSHVWRQDHNGFSHQDPGFIDHVVNKKADIIRVYLPPDANTLLYVTDRCLRSRNLVNVIVAGKQPDRQWLDMEAAINHASAGIGLWEWACNDQPGEPDIVLAAAGDVPTLEMLAAIDILHRLAPDLKIRFINVVDLMTLQPQEEHPHGLSSDEFDSLFTRDKPIIFAYHGYPWLIHRLTYRRSNHGNLHVRGYKEEGTTTTPFDMVVLNTLDRFHLVIDVARRVPKLHAQAAHIKQAMRDKLNEHTQYILEHGEDMPEIRDWQWPAAERKS